MTPRTLSTFLCLLFLALAVGVCSYGSASSSDAREVRTLQIENQNFYDAHVYVFCEGNREKVVRGVMLNETRETRVRSSHCEYVSLIIRLHASSDSWLIRPFAMGDGQCMHLTIQEYLPYSGIVPCRRS